MDRETALSVLNDISHCLTPDIDWLGNKTLVITRNDFERIRKKYLDSEEKQKEQENENYKKFLNNLKEKRDKERQQRKVRKNEKV